MTGRVVNLDVRTERPPTTTPAADGVHLILWASGGGRSGCGVRSVCGGGLCVLGWLSGSRLFDDDAVCQGALPMGDGAAFVASVRFGGVEVLVEETAVSVVGSEPTSPLLQVIAV
ncbi:hypothetical protein [Micromonospora sp. LHW51205]|uniref:hypothetical protein n=1 Tax=Micromonospora sp. LHW51205 TaxID=2248752 RepID=UPI0011BFD53A|nr:hypothetical protein [Micromonospora sp. LHW51205]